MASLLTHPVVPLGIALALGPGPTSYGEAWLGLTLAEADQVTRAWRFDQP